MERSLFKSTPSEPSNIHLVKRYGVPSVNISQRDHIFFTHQVPQKCPITQRKNPNCIYQSRMLLHLLLLATNQKLENNFWPRIISQTSTGLTTPSILTSFKMCHLNWRIQWLISSYPAPKYWFELSKHCGWKRSDHHWSPLVSTMPCQLHKRHRILNSQSLVCILSYSLYVVYKARKEP